MRVLWICKRFYTNKDLLQERYGRLWYLPQHLSEKGIDVSGICLGYGPRSKATAHLKNLRQPHCRWTDASSRLGLLVASFKFLLSCVHSAIYFRPHVIIGASDIPFGFVAWILARFLKAQFVYDVYDNYEAYASARIPGFKRIHRWLLSQADLTLFVSIELKLAFQHYLDTPKRSLVLENGVDPSLFYSRDKVASRRLLGLKQDTLLVGMAGGLSKDRDIDSIIHGFEKFQSTYTDSQLVLLGHSQQLQLPLNIRTVKLDPISYELMPFFWSSLDIGIIGSSSDPQIKFGFPTKFYEMIASKLPFICGSEGPLRRLIGSEALFVYQSGNADSVFTALHFQAEQLELPDCPIITWEELGSALESELNKMVNL